MVVADEPRITPHVTVRAAGAGVTIFERLEPTPNRGDFNEELAVR